MLAVVLSALELLGDLTQLLIAAVAGILVPLWLVLLARGLRRDDESPAMAPAGDSAA